jgi:hypothetical protein
MPEPIAQPRAAIEYTLTETLNPVAQRAKSARREQDARLPYDSLRSLLDVACAEQPRVR